MFILKLVNFFFAILFLYYYKTMKINPTVMTTLKIENLLNSFAKQQTNFNSTKELYSYARKRIVGVARELNKEYLIIADTKKNQIISEKLGNDTNVVVDSWLLPNDRRNITIMHGHPKRKGAHLSMQDCYHLCQFEYDKIIAFNKDGRFSLLQILPESNIQLAKNFFLYGLNAVKNLNLFKEEVSKKILEKISSHKKIDEKTLENFVKNSNIKMRYSSTLNR